MLAVTSFLSNFWMSSNSLHCSSCKVKVPKHRPILTCSICNQYKHYKCNFLTKSEAQQIIADNGYLRSWTCYECISSILPINCTSSNLLHVNSICAQQTTYCAACNKLVNINKTICCGWCDRLCHRTCIKNSLGCTECCVNLIPGYYYYAHE